MSVGVAMEYGKQFIVHSMKAGLSLKWAKIEPKSLLAAYRKS